jgi:predicted nucleic acid-binding Zn ribbon protein
VGVIGVGTGFVGLGVISAGIDFVGPDVGVAGGDCEALHEARRRRYKNSMVQMTLVRCVTIEVSFFDIR